MFYNFTISTNLQYNNSNFKGLWIDSSIAIRSINQIGYLKTLQKIFLWSLIKK